MSAKIKIDTKESATAFGMATKNGSQSTFTSGSIDKPKNNISTYTSGILNRRASSSNPFILDDSPLGKAHFSSGEDFYISSVGYNALGGNETFEIVLNSAEGIEYFTIVFDEYNKAYPFSGITVNTPWEKIYDNNRAVVHSYNLKNKPVSIIVTFNSWSITNSPIKIQGIYSNVVINVTLRNAMGIDYNHSAKATVNLPSYGIISNKGNISFVDSDDAVLGFANNGFLKGGAEVEINLTNTLTHKSEVLAQCITDTWDYNNNSKEVSVSVKDNLEEWQKINVEGINFNPNNVTKDLTNRTMAELYAWLQKETPAKYKMKAFGYLDQDTQLLMQNTFLPFPQLNDDTLWNQWDKLCKACGLYIYKLKNGETTCSYFYGA